MSTPISSNAQDNQAEGQRTQKACPYKRINLYSHPNGLELAIWQHLAARKTGKWSHYSGTQFNTEAL